MLRRSCAELLTFLRDVGGRHVGVCDIQLFGIPRIGHVREGTPQLCTQVQTGVQREREGFAGTDTRDGTGLALPSSPCHEKPQATQGHDRAASGGHCPQHEVKPLLLCEGPDMQQTTTLYDTWEHGFQVALPRYTPEGDSPCALQSAPGLG